MRVVLEVNTERHDFGFVADVRVRVGPGDAGRVLSETRVQLPPAVVEEPDADPARWEGGDPAKEVARGIVSGLQMMRGADTTPPHLDRAIGLAIGVFREALITGGITGLGTVPGLG